MECDRQGLKWRLQMEHTIDREIAQGVFEPSTTELVRKIVKPGMTVMDVGANLGYYTLIFADQVGHSGKVIAFEPVKRYYKQLLWHVEANGFDNCVKAFDYGLSDKTQKVRIAFGNNTSATLHWVSSDQLTGYEQIQLHSLDKIVSQLMIERIDLIKIDIDGHEPFFFRGAKNVVLKHHPILLVEFAQLNLDRTNEDVRILKTTIENLGYTLYSESTRKPFMNRTHFLVECGNCAYSANVWAIPNSLARKGMSLEEIA